MACAEYLGIEPTVWREAVRVRSEKAHVWPILA